MDPLDKARTAAAKALAEARRDLAQAQAMLRELRERRRYDQLLRDLGAAYYAQHRGEGGHDAVTPTLAALDAHRSGRGDFPPDGRT
jgi:hypothetical protein